MTELCGEEERGTGENEREREEGRAETTNGTEARLSVFDFSTNKCKTVTRPENNGEEVSLKGELAL